MADFGLLFSKLMGSGTHCSKIDGFLGTHGTHVNGATVVIYDLKETIFWEMTFQELL